MDKKSQRLYLALSTAMAILAIAAALPIFQVSWTGTRYLFAFGALCVLVVRLLQRYKGANLRIKRLHRMEKVSGMCYVVSAALMFYPMEAQTDWIIFLLVGAILQIYTSFMIEHETKKEEKQSNKK